MKWLVKVRPSAAASATSQRAAGGQRLGGPQGPGAPAPRHARRTRNASQNSPATKAKWRLYILAWVAQLQKVNEAPNVRASPAATPIANRSAAGAGAGG